MWIITKDLISDPFIDTDSQVGKHTEDFEETKTIYEFRLLDDDAIVYYHGVCDTNNDDNAFAPLDYYQPHSGCTEIQYKNNGKWETL